MSLKILISLKRSERRVYSSGQKNTQEIIAKRFIGYVEHTSHRTRWRGLRKLYKAQYLDSRGRGKEEGPCVFPLLSGGADAAKRIADERQ